MTATASIAIPTTMPLPTLCLFSTSKRLADRVLRTCPLSLRMGEHQECPHRKQVRVDLGEGEKPLTVTACECPASPAPLASVQASVTAIAPTANHQPHHHHQGPTSMTVPHSPSAPLWPIPLEVVGVTGEYQSGKTAFLLDIAPDPATTLYYDLEKSGKSYAAQLGTARIDFPEFAQQKCPKGYRPIDLFTLWRDHVLSVKPGQYRVIAVDPINDIQDGLVAWVKENASYFGKTGAQYIKMSQLMWADAKVYLKQLLNEIATRCETFAFSTHMRDVYKGQQATGRREAKGLDTFYEMASAYFLLERRPDSAGRMPNEPVGTVLKDRVAKIVQDQAAGKRKWIVVLPKRMPICTPEAVREYMLNPVGTRDALPAELSPERIMGDDERLLLQIDKAQAERDTELAKLEQMQARGRAAETAQAQQGQRPQQPKNQPVNGSPKAAPPATITAPTAPATQPPAVGPVVTATATTTAPTTAPARAQTTPPTAEQKAEITDLIAQLKLTAEQWSAMLATYGAASGKDLSSDQASDLIVTLKRQNEAGTYFADPNDPALQPQPKLTEAQKGELLTLKEELKALGMKAEHWAKYLADQSVTTALDLTEAKAEAMIRTLRIDLAESQKGGGYIPF